MNHLTTKDRARSLTVLSEGVGVNAACRITGASKSTVLKLWAGVGRVRALYFRGRGAGQVSGLVIRGRNGEETATSMLRSKQRRGD